MQVRSQEKTQNCIDKSGIRTHATFVTANQNSEIWTWTQRLRPLGHLAIKHTLFYILNKRSLFNGDSLDNSNSRLLLKYGLVLRLNLAILLFYNLFK